MRLARISARHLLAPLLFALPLAAGLAAAPAARACDFDVLNQTDRAWTQLRLYNRFNRYLGLGDAGTLLHGEKFRFSQRRMQYGEAAWPDTCDSNVYIDMLVGPPGSTSTDRFGAKHCHILKQIRRPPDATLEADNRNIITITENDLLEAGACQDR
jgi:hypothetical protein